MIRTRNAILTGATAAALLAMTACGRVPTAPDVAATSGGGSAVTGKAPDAASLRSPLAIPTADAGSTEDSVEVNGAKGATIKVGRVNVKIPKHAINGKAQVTVTLPDSKRLAADLVIRPASKNQFGTPVTLEFDASGSADLKWMQVQWFDPTQQSWVDIPTSVNLTTGVVSAQIDHFSSYQVTCALKKKSGW